MEKQGLKNAPRVLIIYYSFSSQTKSLLNQLVKGLKGRDVSITVEKLRPSETLRFPVGTISGTVKLMLTTFFRFLVPIDDISPECHKEYDLIILAGPTWSYNPSGPILSLLKRDGIRTFKDKNVIPLISCRGYWRIHWYGLKMLLKKCGANIPNRIVFTYPGVEPCRTIGVFMKIAGKKVEWPIIKRFYPEYGHSKEQLEEAHRFGEMIGEALKNRDSFDGLDFNTPAAML